MTDDKAQLLMKLKEREIIFTLISNDYLLSNSSISRKLFTKFTSIKRNVSSNTIQADDNCSIECKKRKRIHVKSIHFINNNSFQQYKTFSKHPLWQWTIVNRNFRSITWSDIGWDINSVYSNFSDVYQSNFCSHFVSFTNLFYPWLDMMRWRERDMTHLVCERHVARKGERESDWE